MKNLIKALAEFQQEVPVIHQDTKGYNYTYASLGTILKVINPLLKKHGLGYTQLLDGKGLKTIIFHVESGESIESTVDLPTDSLKGMNAYQSAGSAITYFRRYALSSALSLITDKDIDAAGEKEVVPPINYGRALEECKTLDELQKVWLSIPNKTTTLCNIKDSIKETLS